MSESIDRAPSQTSAVRSLPVISACILVNTVIAVWAGKDGHIWACAINAACAGFNLRGLLDRLERV